MAHTLGPLVADRALAEGAWWSGEEEVWVDDTMFELASLLLLLQNMLMEIEQKVLALAELSMHSEGLLLEGRAGTGGRQEAEQLARKLRTLKGRDRKSVV